MHALKKPYSKLRDNSKHTTSDRDVHEQELRYIPKNITAIVEKIQDKGFVAYMVGGCVRDLLAGIKPKDFDIATDARPEELLKIFPNKSNIIGRRFPIVHVMSGSQRIEVTTFRGTPPKPSPYIKKSKSGQILIDSHYGTVSEDVLRRDLTVNALYYDPILKQVIDYVGGMDDVETRTINIIGKPAARFREDPVRMMRCIRLSNKLGFTMTKPVCDGIKRNAYLIRNSAPARLFEEILKLTLCGQAEKNLASMIELNVFQVLFSQVAKILEGGDEFAKQSKTLITTAVVNTDKRIAAKQTITPSFLIAALLWPEVRRQIGSETPVNRHAVMLAGRNVIDEQNSVFRIPKRFSMRIVNFWQMQHDLQWPTAPSTAFCLDKSDFRAAFDFLLIRKESGELKNYKPHTWWQKIQTCSHKEREKMINALPRRRSKKIPTSLSTSIFTS